MNWIGGFRPKLQEFFFLRCSLPAHPSQEGAVLIGWLLGAVDGEFVIIDNWRFKLSFLTNRNMQDGAPKL